jgi:hypothetical protein
VGCEVVMRGAQVGRRALCAATIATLMASVVLLCAPSAHAALVHPFLGSLAKGKRPFSPEVCGVSIDPATGEILVADPEGGVHEIPAIEIFSSANEFVRKVTGSGTPEEEFEEACSSAVNDKNGILYVADGGGLVIYPFNREGKYEGKRTEESKAKGSFEAITGVETPAGSFEERLYLAINQSTGQLYVADFEDEAVDIFNEQGKYETQLLLPGEEHLPGPIAVNQKTGEIYVGVEGQAQGSTESSEEASFIDVFSASGGFLRQISGKPSGNFPGFSGENLGAVGLTGIAIGTDGNVYVSDAPHRAVYEFTSTGTFLGEITGTPSGPFSAPYGVAVNAANDLYVVDRTEEVNGDQPGQVDYFGPAQAGAPTIERESISNLSATSVELEAEIDPTGTATSYYFELCTGSSAVCRDIPAAPGTSLPASEAAQAVSETATGLAVNTAYTYRVVLHYGPSGESTVTGATESFTTKTEGAGLELIDHRAWEMVSPAIKNGASFEAMSKEGGVIQAAVDGTAITFIGTSPSEANPAGNRNPTFTQNLAHRITNSEGELEWASRDIATPNTRPQGAAPGEEQEYQFFSPDLSLALVEPWDVYAQAEPPLAAGVTGRTSYVRHNDECEAATAGCYVPLLTSETDTAEPETEFGNTAFGDHFVSASRDLRHVVLKSGLQLTTAPAATQENIYEWTASNAPAQQLQLINLIPPLPGQPEGPEKPVQAKVGGSGSGARQAVSDSGSRVIFSTAEHLYLRDVTAGKTVQVDLPESGANLGSAEQAVYQTASSEASEVFFTDRQRLTTDSTALPEPGEAGRPDLYVYDVASGKTKDLTVDPNVEKSGQPERAAVQGVLPGVSEDGSTVYFVANGVLTMAANPRGEKASRGSCSPEAKLPTAICNLYVRHFNGTEWQPTQFVASLSNSDAPDWSEREAGKALRLPTRVSPEGEYIAFMSQRPLTGYDNRDVAPAAHAARDEEVFLYGRGAGGAATLTCASCDRTGARPAGVLDAEESGEGIALVVDRSEVWGGHWLAGSLPSWTNFSGPSALYQSRYLSDSGRLFFDSAAALAPQVTAPLRTETIGGVKERVGAENVYEYEPGSVGSCGEVGGCVGLISSGTTERESAFLDAGETGDDVFILTPAQLVVTDKDTNLDVYDARVCGSGGCIVAKEAVSTSCSSAAECRTTNGGPPPSFGAAASATTSTSGNVSSSQSGVLPAKATKPAPPKLTRAQQLARALKACKKLKSKKKRASCTKQAQKRFGSKKKASKKGKK